MIATYNILLFVRSFVENVQVLSNRCGAAGLLLLIKAGNYLKYIDKPKGIVRVCQEIFNKRLIPVIIVGDVCCLGYLLTSCFPHSEVRSVVDAFRTYREGGCSQINEKM
jgi:hypothetical protein